MKWVKVPEPEYTVHQAKVGDRFYEIRSKTGLGVWRLFLREVEKEPLRTIFTGNNVTACKKYATKFEGRFSE